MSKTQIKFLLLALTAIATLAFAYQMYSLFQAEQLWGHLPLGLTLSAWLFVLLLSEKRFSKHPNIASKIIDRKI